MTANLIWWLGNKIQNSYNIHICTYLIFNIIHWSPSKRKLNISKLNTVPYNYFHRNNYSQLHTLHILRILWRSALFCSSSVSWPLTFFCTMPTSLLRVANIFFISLNSTSCSSRKVIICFTVIGLLTCSSNPFFISASCCFNSANSASAFSISCITHNEYYSEYVEQRKATV